MRWLCEEFSNTETLFFSVFFFYARIEADTNERRSCSPLLCSVEGTFVSMCVIDIVIDID